MLISKVHNLLIKFGSGLRSCRHVGIVGPHDFHTAEVHFLQSLKVRLPAVFFRKIVCNYVSTNQVGSRRISRIARIRYQHLVALVYESHADEEDSLFRTEERLDFAVRVQCYLIISFVPVCKCLSECRETHITLISMVTGLGSSFLQCSYGLSGRHTIRSPDTEVYDFVFSFRNAGVVKFVYFFQFPGKIVLTDRLCPFSRFYYHNSVPDIYSPIMSIPSIRGRMAASA